MSTQSFRPIAVIGRGCILPGAGTPTELWDLVRAQKVVCREANLKDWRIHPDEIVKTQPGVISKDSAWHGVGGYLPEIPPFIHDIYGAVDPALDDIFHMIAHAALQALEESGRPELSDKPAAGLIMGNLGYPVNGFTDFAAATLLNSGRFDTKRADMRLHPANRFASSLPLLYAAERFGLKGPCFALDAACASGLYAIKLACDQLHSGKVDFMLAGGVNASDFLCLQTGFAALGALSHTGRSLPFCRNADGLIPAHGAAIVALKRLEDALADKNDILGVIRGVGLSNDGRAGSFLTPDGEGQLRALRQAYCQSGIAPGEVGYIECHATGTRLGDAVEIKTLDTLCQNGKRPCLGSLKACIGHTITASGTAGLLKVLGMMEHACLPGTPNTDPLNKVFQNAPFEVLQEDREWSGRKLAGISSFGFGGNNAHLLVEAWENDAGKFIMPGVKAEAASEPRFAIVGIEVKTHLSHDYHEFQAQLRLPPDEVRNLPVIEHIRLGKSELFFPPSDLEGALGQQLLIAQTAYQAIQGVSFDPASTGIFIGMQCDGLSARYLVRTRLPALFALTGEELERARDAVSPPLLAANVIGAMANITANRLNHALSAQGPSFAISAEELSGDAALDVAMNALARGEITTAVVGAADLCREETHMAAVRELLPDTADPGDAAVVFVLKTIEQAGADKDAIIAELIRRPADRQKTANSQDRSDDCARRIEERFGHAHCARGLLRLAAAMAHGEGTDSRIYFENKEQLLTIRNRSFAGGQYTWRLRVPNDFRKPLAARESARQYRLMRAFAANSPNDLASLLKQKQKDRQLVDGTGPARAIVLGRSEVELDEAQKDLANAIEQNAPPGWISDNSVFYPQPIGGEIGFVFTGAAAAYPEAGTQLVSAFPMILDAWIRRGGGALPNAFKPGSKLGAFDQLRVSSAVNQIHACLSRDILGIEPQAAIGLSSGETNALYALGVWTHMQGLLDDVESSQMYDRHLGGEYRSARDHWKLKSTGPADFTNWAVFASPEAVRNAIGANERVYVTIINTDEECLIAGERSRCLEVIEMIGDAKPIPLDFNLCCHCPAVQPFRETWRRIHHRPTTSVDNVRFYSNYLGRTYEKLDSDSIADALTGQALETVDFPRIVRKAWEDGVRIFIEHGPRDQLTTAIKKILKGKPHLALALDSPQSPIRQIYRVAAELWAAGVDLDLDFLNRRAKRALRQIRPEPALLILPLRRPPVQLDFLTAVSDPAEHRELPNRPEPDRQRLPEPPPLHQEILYAMAPQSALVTAGHRAEHAVSSLSPSTGSSGAAWEILRRSQSAHIAYLKHQQEAQAAFLNLSRRIRSRAFGQTCAARPGSAPRHSDDAGSSSVRERMAAELRRSGPAASALWEWPEMLKLASGGISDVFGPEFREQDKYPVQVRLPEPPLLLCERVLGIDAVPKSMGTGTIWTEHTVTEDKWYLHRGRMPAGIFIECGQADLTLISWLGIDFYNRGERMYRLLGCEITWLGEMPKVGDVLKYEIRVTRHAMQGDIRLFFFEYECWIDGDIRARVRNGHAGFFTREELNESKGVIWEPTPDQFVSSPSLLQGPLVTEKRNFTRVETEAFACGEPWNCFGEAFSYAKTHHRSPCAEPGRLNFIHRVTHFEPRGGPAGRGYMRAEQDVDHEGCFLDGHFLNDPCMPGTLMANGCLQMSAFFLTALGFTLKKDGSRFTPKPDHPVAFLCRGEVNPNSKMLVYELFVDEIIDEAGVITLYAHALVTVDGLKALFAHRSAVSLVPGWPADCLPESAWETGDTRPLAHVDGFPLDYKSLMNCATGKPSKAFGPRFAHYDGGAPCPRLPSPPYHFMTRITRLDADVGKPKVGSNLEALCDIPSDAWYFTENSDAVMPFCVLMEIALQPCGWLATANLDASVRPVPHLLFRNLDGKGVVHRAITPLDRAIRTTAKLTSHSKMGETIIVKFDVHCFVETEEVFALETVFGFFPESAFRDQTGLEVEEEERDLLNAPANYELNLDIHPSPWFGKGGKLPASKLLMVDRVTGYWPNGGKAGKGRWRGEKQVDPGDWYFKAHFHGDPVQPGSLGVEGIMQLIQLHMLHKKMDRGLDNPRFEPCLPDRLAEWHYRGQVSPDNDKALFEIEILEEGETETGRYAEAEGRLWVNDKKIYHVTRIGMRLE